MSVLVERRGLPLGWWLFGLGMVLAVVWIFLAVPSVWGPVVAFLLSSTLVLLVLVRMSLQTLEITEDALVVHGARLPLARIEKVQVHLGDQWRRAIVQNGGPQTWLNSRAHHRGGVVLELAPTTDPVRLWLVSSPDPERLAKLLEISGRIGDVNVDGGSDGS